MAPAAESAGDAVQPSDIVLGCLQSRLGRYQAQAERLQGDNLALAARLAASEAALRDAHELLRAEGRARDAEVAALEAKVAALQETLAAARAASEVELARAHADNAHDAEAAAAQVAALRRQVAAESDFAARRDDLEAALSLARQAAESAGRDHQQRISDLERQLLQERERGRREAAAKIAEARAAMAAVADAHLEASTRRTLLENAALAGELAHAGGVAARLGAANDALRGERGELRHLLEAEQRTSAALARKSSMLLGVLKELLARLQQQKHIGVSGGDAGGSATLAALAELSSGGGNTIAAELQTDERVLQSGAVAVVQREEEGESPPQLLLPSPQPAAALARTSGDGGGGGGDDGSRVEERRAADPEAPSGASSTCRAPPDDSCLAESDGGARGAGDAAAVGRALDDGAVGFVLGVVDQLRRGGALSTLRKSCVAGDGAAAAAVREQVAEFLLEQLHRYARAPVPSSSSSSSSPPPSGVRRASAAAAALARRSRASAAAAPLARVSLVLNAHAAPFALPSVEQLLLRGGGCSGAAGV